MIMLNLLMEEAGKEEMVTGPAGRAKRARGEKKGAGIKGKGREKGQEGASGGGMAGRKRERMAGFLPCLPETEPLSMPFAFCHVCLQAWASSWSRSSSIIVSSGAF